METSGGIAHWLDRISAGEHVVRFTPRAAGVYLVRMRLGVQEKTLKMVAVK